ncbi:MAG: chloride channel protein [Deltaproteobacteria bacterium]|nr:chloride channel protein [Deltaproteobacteria bacterium]
MQILGRTLLHAALVGLGAGLIGAAFFAGLEYMQWFLLEYLCGYSPLRAHGERFIPGEISGSFRPWLLVFLPALGGLAAGLIMRMAPETRGGGGDAMIDAFHHSSGVIRRRVMWVKALASLFTLGTGGAGGREGPTMQIGGALGSAVGRALRVIAQERRVLMVAGVAAGISAVFRTPLGAAILAVEVLYRDDFEAEALIPAILGSVIAYSVVISIFGESTLFARAPRYPFIPRHLPLYGLLAVMVALLATVFVGTLRRVHSLSNKLPGPAWIRPGLGGLALGLMAVPLIVYLSGRLAGDGKGLGIFGGGYGAAQMAITGADWLPTGWAGVEILLFLCGVKILAASLTIGTGGSAGDFAPSLVMGALFGGAFGRAAQLILHDPTIDPGAFALVGMGAFYGGIAHVPVSALILVSELAGSYDLLVPLMLAEGIAFVALRKRQLYSAQVPLRKDSPAHRADVDIDVLRSVQVATVVVRNRAWLTFELATPTHELAHTAAQSTWQDIFPVVDELGNLKGIITSDRLRSTRDVEAFTIAADVMQPVVSVRTHDNLRIAAERMLASGLRELLVLDETGKTIGFLDEAEISRAFLEATGKR